MTGRNTHHARVRRNIGRLALGLVLIPALAYTSLAIAGTVTNQIRAEASSSIEGLPQQDGESWARMRHGLFLRTDLTSRMVVVASGQLFFPIGGGDTDIWDEAVIQRLSFQYSGRVVSVRAGRFVHVGTLGLTRADGFKVDLHPDSPVGGHVWAGRIGHAESLSIGGDLGVGAQFRLTPGALGLAAGYDLRFTPVALAHRIHLSSTVRSKKGVSLFVAAELGFDSDERADETPDAPVESDTTDDGEAEAAAADEDVSPSGGPGFRATARASFPLGTRASLRIGGRYYGLPPISAPWSSQSVVETIRPTDYGVAEVSVELRPRSELRVRIEGGPTFGQTAAGYEDVVVDSDEPAGIETDLGLGATGKAAFDYKGLGLYGTGTFVSGAWYAGGGVGVRQHVGPVTLWGEAGLYRFQGLDGTEATVGEARFQGELALPSRPTWGEFGLVVRTAVGTDRMLSPWWRAGVAVQGRFGSARGAL